MKSPYNARNRKKWKNLTEDLIKNHPLKNDFREIVLDSWKAILTTEIADVISIVKMKPRPQIMGEFLHEVIAYKIQAKYPKKWRREENADEKDVVCVKNDDYSFEIKTSSSKNRIYGNKSYAQKALKSKKYKSGYYLAVNFESFNESDNPEIKLIRFGWIDHSDWIPQKSESGQQARLSTEVEEKKLLKID